MAYERKEPKSIKLWSTDIKKVFLGSTQIRPTNTFANWLLAYYPLESDANDHKADLWATGTTYNWTWTWTANYTTLGWKTVATFNTSNYIDTGITCGSWPLTVACMYYCTSQSGYKAIIWTPFTWSWAPAVWLFFYQNYIYAWGGNMSRSEADWFSIPNQERHFAAIRVDENWQVDFNVDSAKHTRTTTSFTINDVYYIWEWTSNKFNGWICRLWIWNRSLSDDELAEYKTYIEWL